MSSVSNLIMDSILGEFHRHHADDGEWPEEYGCHLIEDSHNVHVTLLATTGLVGLEHLYQRGEIRHQQLTLQNLIDHTRQRTICRYC
jgi:hypothetical protein